MGRSEQAVALYQQALDRDPNRASLYAGLGSIYRQRSQPEQARAMYEKARQLGGQDPNVLFEMARLAYEEHEPAPEIVAMLQKVLQKQPMNAQALVLLGDVYLDQGRRKQARQQYEHACQLTSPATQVGQEARRKLQEIEPPASRLPNQDWAGDGRRLSPDLRRRPGCITIYALLSGASAALSLLTACGMGTLLLGNRSALQRTLAMEGTTLPLDVGQITTMAGLYFAVILGVGLFNLTIAIGLWNMKNWARIVEIVRQGLGLLGSLVATGAWVISFRAASASLGITHLPTFLLVMLFIGLLIQGYLIFWFAANREMFN
jgi:tetratricopeptide (TPR) repeat protein